ncbi:hypothetical protein D3C76_1018750 [compost metagenome]
MFEQQRALAKVVQCQRRQHHGEPGQTNRQLTEVAHICVQRFHTGNRQHDSAERDKRHGFVFEEEVDRPHWVQRLQHFRVGKNTAQPERRQDQEPGQHNRRKQLTHQPRTVLLNREQQCQHNNGERHHPSIQLRRDNLQPLYR